MLSLLRRIVQEVTNAEDLPQALNIMVDKVAKAINIECCSVFLKSSNKDEYYLVASIGFSRYEFGSIKIKKEEGLVGLVASREEPINLEDAPSHPNYHYVPETGEEIYKAFLGVPIIHQRRVLGVLVVQQRQSRCFSEGEESFLITIAAQLAGVIAHAHAVGKISHLLNPSDSTENPIAVGVAASSGVAIGKAVVVYPPADLDAVFDRKVSDIAAEINNFNQALQDTKTEINLLSQKLSSTLPPAELALFNAYIQILDGNSLGAEVEAIIQEGNWAPAALKQVINKHVANFEAMDDDYLKERAADIKDLGRRVLSHLQRQNKEKASYFEKTILIGEDISAAALAEVPAGMLVGVVAAQGSSNSHVAILARALNVPTVMGANNLPLATIDGADVIVDGYNGEVYINPTETLKAEFKKLEQEEQELYAGLSQLRSLRAETLDGKRITLCVNAGLAADIKPSLQIGAEGVGLYRTEVPFMVRDKFPTEAEQFAIYRHLLEAFHPKMVTIRTLDIGGDKSLPYFPIQEPNPFLGWRGIRLTLDHPEIFLVQIRAILKANEKLNNLRILLPMITSTFEVKESKKLINRAHYELMEEGHDLLMPPIGVMVEVPAAVYQIRELARISDFISVGSNDLVQYLLAVDRNNGRVNNIFDIFHPAVIRALTHIVNSVHAEQKVVTICGEMASDPLAAILLLGMNFDAMSMNANSLLKIKWVVRNFTITKAEEILHNVLKLEDGGEIKAYLQKALESQGLGGLIRAGK